MYGPPVERRPAAIQRMKLRARYRAPWSRRVRAHRLPLLHGLSAGLVIWLIASLGVFYVWHEARSAQLNAVRTELLQLARVAARQVNGDLHRTLTSPSQAGSKAHLELLAPLVEFHKATTDVIYVYTAVLDGPQIYFVLDTEYLYRHADDPTPPDPIMKPYDTPDPALRLALTQHRAAVNREPVHEKLRSYMSAYAPFFDRQGRFAGVVGIDMWVRNLDARLESIRRAGLIAFARRGDRHDRERLRRGSRAMPARRHERLPRQARRDGPAAGGHQPLARRRR